MLNLVDVYYYLLHIKQKVHHYNYKVCKVKLVTFVQDALYPVYQLYNCNFHFESNGIFYGKLSFDHEYLKFVDTQL